ncbi:MAG: formylglycine-generating enzyme family protein, partial [bacterium]
YPVYYVSWYDAVKFCNRLSYVEGLESCYNESTWACDFNKSGFRLPTEAEWEYACRAGTETNFYTGNSITNDGYSSTDLERAGWYGYGVVQANVVGAKEPNAFGLYDMHGNVWEWCNDWYRNYSSGSVTDPTGFQTGSYRVIRGGSWSSYASLCRSAKRGLEDPDVRVDEVGFRITRRSSPQSY